MYISLFAITIALTHFLLNPLNKVNQANPRFVGFTCRMKPLFEYSRYLSGYFSAMTGISIQNPWQQSVNAGHIHFYLSTPGWIMFGTMCQIFIFHDSRQFMCLFILHFSLLCGELFVFLSLQDQDKQDFGLAKPAIDNTSDQILQPNSRSHIEVCQTSHEI